MWTISLLKVDRDEEILKANELLKVDYNPDRIIQHYFKDINEAKQLLTALNETVTEDKVIKNTYATLEKHIN